MADQAKAPQAVTQYRGKNFDARAIETFLYDWWESSGFFTPPAERSGETPFVMMLPLPNVTGDLHLGHALSFGGYEDLMARWHRMRGEPTLWLPGSDHAGIIAQIVVEKELAKEFGTRKKGPDAPREQEGLDREQFLGEMWRWMEHYKPRIYRQLRMLGCSLDWSRVHFTMDPDMQRRVRIHFIRLYRRGHLYRANRIVHWCLTCGTTYSDLESKHIVRTDQLSYVRYPWADPMPAGTPDVVVATTRPETILADTAIAVHPEDDRWKAFIGKEVLVPVVERRVKIVGDAAVDREFGTGALKVTPGHDATDFDIGQRHGLQVLSVIDTRGLMTAAAGPLAGLDRDTGRTVMIDRLTAKGLLVRQEPITHAVGVHERCDTVDEPLVMKQWWMRMPPLAKPAIDAVRTGTTKIIPSYQEKIYFEWMENIRDWPVSRQIWWGHAIPVWYCRDCEEVVVPDDDDAPDPTTCPKCRSNDLRQDPDVLDTWFSSALWPHSTLGWPEKTADLARFYPGSVLETGYDILFYWVARMMMMGLENMGVVPFHTVYLHGLVRMGNQKMSKSKGNVVSPVGMIEEHGADALRYALVNGVSAGADSEFSEGKLENGRRFVNKLWNIGRFVLVQLEARPGALAGPIDVSPAGSPDLTEADRWILSRTEATAEELTRLIETYQFGEYATALQQFVWAELADVYVELAKPQRRPAGSLDAAVRTLAYVFDRVLRLAHPIMPFVTDTLALQLWEHGAKDDPAASLVVSRWPASGRRDVGLEERFGLVIEVIRRIRERRQDTGVDPRATVRVSLGGDAEPLRPFTGIIGSLAGAEVGFGRGAGAPTPPTMVRSVQVWIDVPQDAGADRARLEKELAAALQLLEGSRTLLASDFATRAPAPVVEKARAALAEREAAVASLKTELEKAS